MASMRVVVLNINKIEQLDIHLANMRAVIMNGSKVEHAKHIYS